MKKKHKIILIIAIIFGIALVAGLIKYYEIKKEQKTILLNIKNNYYQNVEVKEKANIYSYENNKYKETGYIAKGEIIHLDKIKAKSYKDIYYKIDKENCYIKYNKVKPYYNTKPKDSYIYLNYGLRIIPKDNYNLLKNNNVVFNFKKSREYEVIQKSKNYYKVNYNDELLTISNSDIESEKIQKNYHNATKISVIYYDNIYDTKEKCTSDSCVKKSFLEKNIQYLKDNGYQTITLSDYKLWMNEEIKLPENVVLIMDTSKNKSFNNSYDNIYINEDDKTLNFIDNNKQSILENKKYNRYKIVSETTDTDFKKIVSGKDVSYEKYIGKGIAVLNYHFFYDPDAGETCNENICEPIKKFKEQLDYLKDNNFKTLTMEEFKEWMYGTKELSGKNVLITIDNGAMGTSKINGNKLIPILEEYNINATLFLISAWWQKSNYSSQNLLIQSHGYDIHKMGSCNKPRALCLSEESLETDLKKSINLVDSNLSMAYPFYAQNESVKKVVKASGFSLAFIGGGRKAYQSSDKYAIPRFEIFNTTTMEQLKRYVN